MTTATDPAAQAAAAADADEHCAICPDPDNVAQFRQFMGPRRRRAPRAAPATPPASPPPLAPSATATAPAADPYAPWPPAPTAASLGRGTWTFLHTLAAYYPERPTPAEQTRMRSFLGTFAEVYPCGSCAAHMQAAIQPPAAADADAADTVGPPATESRAALSHWMCQLHNEVNVRLEKPVFDCTRVLQRWRADMRAAMAAPARAGPAADATILGDA